MRRIWSFKRLLRCAHEEQNCQDVDGHGQGGFHAHDVREPSRREPAHEHHCPQDNKGDAGHERGADVSQRTDHASAGAVQRKEQSEDLDDEVDEAVDAESGQHADGTRLVSGPEVEDPCADERVHKRRTVAERQPQKHLGNGDANAPLTTLKRLCGASRSIVSHFWPRFPYLYLQPLLRGVQAYYATVNYSSQ